MTNYKITAVSNEGKTIIVEVENQTDLSKQYFNFNMEDFSSAADLQTKIDYALAKQAEETNYISTKLSQATSLINGVISK